MKPLSRQLFLSVAIALCFMFTLAALAQEQKAAPAAPETPAPTAVAPETAPATTPAVAAPAEPAKTEMRRLDTAPAVEVAPVEKKSTDKDDVQPARPSRRSRRSVGGNHGSNDRVSVMGETHVLADEKIDGNAVGVLADVIVDGEVFGDAVAVMGDNTINGTVNGSAVAVMGDIHLGPKAKVTGDVVCVGGDLHREPGAEIGGKIVKKSIGGNQRFGPNFNRWWSEGFKPARMLGFTPAFNWMWVLTIFLLAFYGVLALVFPGGVRRSGDMLVRRPVAVVVSAILTMLALPLLFVLLLITVVGIPVALLVLPMGVVLAVLFGKAAIYGLVGRTVAADRLHPALAVLVGAVPFVLLSLVPLAGLMLSLLVSLLGLGCVVTALVSSDKKPALPAPLTPSKPVTPLAPMTPHTPIMPMTSPMMAGAASLGAVATAEGVMSAPPPFSPRNEAAPPVAFAALPRAGFWIRTGALFIDGIVVAVCFGPWAGPLVLPILALYGALLWKFRGTTIGGIVCGLQVVRLDDRPLDWPTVAVRALACFLSLVVVGLGFVWVAFDDEKQSWHDKIAGTTVVRPTKRPSLV